MKKAFLESKFNEYCHAFNLTAERSRREGEKYITATPGTVYLAKSDPRAGNKYAIAINGEGGTMSIIYGYVSADHLCGYMAGIIEGRPAAPKWKLTDSNCNQYGRKLSEKIFEFKEDRLTGGPHSKKEKHQAIIDLSKYTDEQIENVISSYGYGLAKMPLLYGLSANWIIAECIFESE